MRRRALLGASAVALAGCATSEGSDDVVIDDNTGDRPKYQFDAKEGETIRISVTLNEPHPGTDWAKLRLMNLPEGTVGEWEVPYDGEEHTYEHVAEHSVEFTIRMLFVTNADVVVEVVDDA